MKPFGDAFIKLVRMIVADHLLHRRGRHRRRRKPEGAGPHRPRHADLTRNRDHRALMIGLTVVNVVKPGAGMNVDRPRSTRRPLPIRIRRARTDGDRHAALDYPVSPVDAFARTDILQVLFFSVLFGIALSALGDKGRPVTEGSTASRRCSSGLWHHHARGADRGVRGHGVHDSGRSACGRSRSSARSSPASG